MQKIQINGKEYNISFNFGVIKGVTKECNCTTPEMIAKLSEGDLDIISSVLYHGIKPNHPNFEQKEVDALSLVELFASFNTIGELMNNSMPKADTSKKTPKKKK